MPYFEVDEIDIDPSEYVYACNKKEINELIECLQDKGYIITKPKTTNIPTGYDEQIYEEALKKLSGKWNMLSQAESEFITALAKRF